jgi:hypothetical protein
MALQYVADANLQTVTLGSNYTLGDTSMALTTGQGAGLLDHDSRYRPAESHHLEGDGPQ